jgi:hypothetical protein
MSINSVNKDILLEIFSFCDEKALFKCSQTNKEWNNLLKSAEAESLWKAKYLQLFSTSIKPNLVNQEINFREPLFPSQVLNRSFKEKIRNHLGAGIASEQQLLELFQRFVKEVDLNQMGSFTCFFPLNNSSSPLHFAFGYGSKSKMNSIQHASIQRVYYFTKALEEDITGCIAGGMITSGATSTGVDSKLGTSAYVYIYINDQLRTSSSLYRKMNEIMRERIAELRADQVKQNTLSCFKTSVVVLVGLAVLTQFAMTQFPVQTDHALDDSL